MEKWKKKTAVFLASQSISLLGSSLVQYAIIWHITLTEKSGFMMTLSILCGFLPLFVMTPFAGVWADRFDRKKLIILADGFIAAVTLAAAMVFLLGYGQLWMLFVMLALRALGSAVQHPAVHAFLPQIVPQEKLTKVGGLNTSLQSTIMIASPMLGGLLLSLAPMETVFFVDVVTAAIAMLILAFALRVQPHERAAAPVVTGYFKDLYMGIKYVIRHDYLRLFFIYCLVFYVFVTPVAFLTGLQVTRSFNGGEWHLAALEVAFSSGMLLGGLIIATWGGFKNRVYTMILSSAIFGAGALALGIVTDFWVYLGIMAFMGLGMPAFNTPSSVLIQEKVESDYLGRVFGVMGMLSTSVMPLCMLFYGILADIFSVELLLIITGPLMLVTAFAMTQSSTLVRAGWPVPKEEAEAETP